MDIEEKIMIVDDVPENLRVLQSMLKIKGFATRTLPSGQMALEAIEKEIPDLILLDITMPGLSGYEVCEIIHNNPKYSEIPIIFISALSDVKEKVKGLEVGGVDFITKPFQLDEVLARVETHLKLSRANQKLKNTLKELKETQAQLVHSEKMASLGLLASGMAHEINNPLNSIVGNTSVLGNAIIEIKKLWKLINDDDLDKDAFKQKLNKLKNDYEFDDLFESSEKIVSIISQASSRAVNIVKSLREFIHEGKSEIQLVNINNCVENTLFMIDYLFDDKIKLIKNLSFKPQILTDEGKVNQILLNLITNAIDAVKVTNRVGEIKVFTKIKLIDNNNFCLISIEDNGSGISDKQIEKIFDPFYTTKDVGKGTGLGLSISVGLIKSLNGNITCKSKMGEGSIFTVYLPIIESEITLDNNE